MGIDAFALLKLSAPDVRKSFFGRLDRVRTFGPDAVAFFTALRFEDLRRDPTLASQALASALGGAALRHTDPRGVLVFPDVAEPRASTYDELVTELEPAGFWSAPQ